MFLNHMGAKKNSYNSGQKALLHRNEEIKTLF